MSFALVLALHVGLPAISNAQVVEAHAVNINGTDYILTELVHVKRYKIPKWNALRLRCGERYHEYRQLDSGYTLKVSDENFRKHEAALKEVPDNRTFDEKHPYILPTINTINLGWSILSVFI